MQIYNDECLNVVRNMESNSIDAVVTDPPYGLKFMNKKWDYDVPSVETWKEILRVMKPGATLLCFAGSRTQHRMAVNIEDAGFIIKDTIMWLYGSGFPKATDISKQLDKIAGEEREVISIREDFCKRANKKKHESVATIKGFIHPEEVGKITIPTTDEAKKWNGWKSHGLKPAYEPIIMAVKTNEGSYAENALKWNVAGINIDACRLGGGWERSTPHRQDMRGGNFNRQEERDKRIELPPQTAHENGRYPANVIFSHHIECKANKCHEDCPIGILDEQSGDLKSGSGNGNAVVGESGKITPLRRGTLIPRYDEGGASRFFYCAKAYKTERDMGCDELEEKIYGQSGGANIAIREGKEEYIQKGIGLNRLKKVRNDHPTVKPIKVMEYLCRMISMPDKIIVLDPFMGSGTTGIACINIGLDFIGIEREEKYFKIAENRLNHIIEEVIEKPKKREKAVNLFF